MSRKVLDAKGRWRNKVVAFRMSPDEDEILERLVAENFENLKSMSIDLNNYFNDFYAKNY